MFQYELSG